MGPPLPFWILRTTGENLDSSGLSLVTMRRANRREPVIIVDLIICWSLVRFQPARPNPMRTRGEYGKRNDVVPAHHRTSLMKIPDKLMDRTKGTK
jgi:hypothetical protein